MAKILTDYIGIEPFTVNIDDSSELKELAERARKLRELPFSQKLDAVKQLALGAMENAYEKWQVIKQIQAENNKYRDIVVSKHPLSFALQQKAGCCRYQGALFFVLGYEADLGDHHFIQEAPVGSMKSVFNDVVQGNKINHVSIFKESLKEKSLDYSVKNPRVFESAIGFPFPKDNPSPEQDFGWTFYSYHRSQSGLVIVANADEHALGLNK